MYLTSHFGFAAVASGNDLESDVIADQNASSERSPNQRKANYDLDQSTEEDSKNLSLNSNMDCLKVVDTFRAATLPAARTP